MSSQEELIEVIREIVSDHERGDRYDYAEGFQRIVWTLQGYDIPGDDA